MRQTLSFIAFAFVAFSVGFSALAAPLGAPTPDPKIVVLPEDEIILPPLLKRVEGGILNVTSLKNIKRSAKEGEWMEFGDYFSLSKLISFEVILRETIQWVGGGVFQGRIGQRTWHEGANTPYEVFLERGWMKVWVKPDEHKNSIKVFTKNVYLKSDHAAFWLTTRPGRTEVYLVEGEIEDSVGHVYKEKKFYLWEGEKQTLKFSSKDWDEKAIEVQISGLFPSLVKAADLASDEWKSGESQRTYAGLRRQGWRKVDRHQPDPEVYPSRKKN